MAKQHASRVADAKIIEAFDADNNTSLLAQKRFLAAMDRMAERDEREKERERERLEAIEQANRPAHSRRKRPRKRKWQLRRRIVVSVYSASSARWGG